MCWGSTGLSCGLPRPPPSSLGPTIHPRLPQGGQGALPSSLPCFAYPGLFFLLHFSREEASSQALVVKNLPAARETRVQSLGQEDDLQEGAATHSSLLAWRILMDRGAWRALAQGVTKTRTRLK